jgi:two-component system phosphate regulon sensor histidine kinase PhoR
MLETETERLTRRIERLLDWGRMEAGRKLYELHGESVKDILDEAVAAFPSARLGEDVDFAVEVAPDLPKLRVDRHAMADAIVNLLSNAHKYGGSPAVVRLRARMAARHNEVVIEVTDNGAGIARPEQRRIFDKFYRIDDRLSRRRDGSGLGLAIVKHVARAHGARVTVDSAAGKGSTFSIFVPVPKTAREPAPRERGSSSPPALETDGGRTKVA